MRTLKYTDVAHIQIYTRVRFFAWKRTGIKTDEYVCVLIVCVRARARKMHINDQNLYDIVRRVVIDLDRYGELACLHAPSNAVFLILIFRK